MAEEKSLWDYEITYEITDPDILALHEQIKEIQRKFTERWDEAMKSLPADLDYSVEFDHKNSRVLIRYRKNDV